MSVCMFLLLAVVGMAFDLGRVYIARNEAQIFADAASMSAAKQLDGTAAGLDRARAAVTALPNRWNLGTEDFSGVVTEFSADGKQWEAEPKDLKALHYARVTAPDNHVDDHVPARRGRAAEFHGSRARGGVDQSGEAYGMKTANAATPCWNSPFRRA